MTEPPLDREAWQRFHPLTPLLRGGAVFVAVVVGAVGHQADAIFGEGSLIPSMRNLLIGLGVLFLGAVGALVVGWLTWRLSRFRVGASTLELHTGLVFRQHRQLRYDRVQAIDVVRPLLARLVGLAELRLQAAGGNESDVRLAYLSAARAQALRSELLELAGRGDEVSPVPADTPGGPVPQSRSSVVLRIPNVRLVQSALYSFSTLAILLTVPAIFWGLANGQAWVLPTLGPVLLGAGPKGVGRILKEANFELTRAADAVQVRHGLTETRTSTIPLHRIQAVSVDQPLFWRPLGWWRVEVNVAGVQATGDDSEDVIVSVGTREEVLGALRVLWPALPHEPVLAGLLGDGPTPGYTVAPPQAAWISPWVRQRNGYAVLAEGVLVRTGRASRTLELVPHARIQSMTVRQGPLDRLLGLASVHLLSTPGSVDPKVYHLTLAEAESLFAQQAGRSRLARAAARAG